MYIFFSEVSPTPHIFSQKFVLTAHLPVRDIFPTHVIIINLDLTTVFVELRQPSC